MTPLTHHFVGWRSMVTLVARPFYLMKKSRNPLNTRQGVPDIVSVLLKRKNFCYYQDLCNSGLSKQEECTYRKQIQRLFKKPMPAEQLSSVFHTTFQSLSFVCTFIRCAQFANLAVNSKAPCVAKVQHLAQYFVAYVTNILSVYDFHVACYSGKRGLLHKHFLVGSDQHFEDKTLVYNIN